MNHHGVILDVGKGWDRGGVGFCSLYSDEDQEQVYLFYSGTDNKRWHHSSIGVAQSKKFFEFTRINHPIMESVVGSFCEEEALTPTVTKVGGRYYMVFAGRPRKNSSRRIGIAVSDRPGGPWKILGTIAKPERRWEGHDIDCGPGVVYLDDQTRLFFYSNVTPLSLLSFKGLREFVGASMKRNFRRSMGLLKVRIRGPSINAVEVYRSHEALSHLNGPRGSWNESVFCPGYFAMEKRHFLVPACSNYSVKGGPHQSIGLVMSNSTSFGKDAVRRFVRFIDGVDDKERVLPMSRGPLALDTPAPIIHQGRLILFYSVMDRSDGAWKISASSMAIEELPRES